MGDIRFIFLTFLLFSRQSNKLIQATASLLKLVNFAQLCAYVPSSNNCLASPPTDRIISTFKPRLNNYRIRVNESWQSLIVTGDISRLTK